MPALRSQGARRHRARSKLMRGSRNERLWNGCLWREADIRTYLLTSVSQRRGSAAVRFTQGCRRHLATDQSAHGQQRKKVGQHDQQSVGNGDAERWKLELQRGEG